MSTKESKKRKHKESKDKDKKVKKQKTEKTIMGYTNESNPFGDTNLTNRFVWHKKVEQEGDKNGSKKKKKRDIQDELEKAKKRREEREREKQLWEEEMARLDRERNKTQWDDWENKEMNFHLQQAKKRSEIRIKEGRAKAIDWIYQWIMLGYSVDKENENENQLTNPVYNPCYLLETISVDELKELKEDIDQILSAQSTLNDAYEILLIICENEIVKFSNMAAGQNSIKDLNIDKILSGKSSDELDKLKVESEQILLRGGAVDVAFWEALLKELTVYRAKAKVNEIHKEIMEIRAKLLENHKVQQVQQIIEEKQEMQRKYHEEQESKVKKESGDYTAEDIMLKREFDRGFAQNEELFESEVNLQNLTYSWHDQHRPRKPKYFNRIKTGYEWNKYNQTHYDYDNPPPKIVQGYKFNIFYPDLIDPTKSPTFSLEKSSDDSTVIHFHAGPPYEDIAFRIVNREWELSHKKGYRCIFDKGVLQLWFNFKRYRYRR